MKKENAKNYDKTKKNRKEKNLAGGLFGLKDSTCAEHPRGKGACAYSRTNTNRGKYQLNREANSECRE